MKFIKLNDYTEVAINYLPNTPYANIHHYINVGIMNDYSYCNGIAHLAEHVLIDTIFKKYKTSPKYISANAYVDKEYTCFHGECINQHMGELLNDLLSILKTSYQITENVVESEKIKIADVENNNVLNNAQLMNILRLEYCAFDDALSLPTLVNRTEFMKIRREDVLKFIQENYYSFKHYIIISSCYTFNQVKKMLGCHFGAKSVVKYENNKCFCKNSDLFNQGFEKEQTQNTICIFFEKMNSMKEYFTAQIILLIYRIHVNRYFKNYEVYINDITVKCYSNYALLFITYNVFFNETIDMLKKLNLSEYEDEISLLKKHFFFGYMKKTSDLDKYHKEVFKSFFYFNEKFHLKYFEDIIEQISFDDIKAMHNSILSGKHITHYCFERMLANV